MAHQRIISPYRPCASGRGLAPLAHFFLAVLAWSSWAVAAPRPPVAQDKPQQPNAQQQKPAGDTTQPQGAAKPSTAPENTRKTYAVRNGTEVYYRTEESERKSTPDGEVETERLRMPSWQGDHRVLMERETRTKKLPDGTVQKEYVLKNPDGADRLAPIEIVRERITKSGDKTSIERETLRPDPLGEGHWTAVRKEHIDETGPATARQTVKEVSEPSVTGDWKVVDREATSDKSSPTTGSESHSVRQLPDAYGRLAGYEVRDERTIPRAGGETHEVTLSRRDFQDADPRKFYLVEHTVSDQSTSPDGKQIVHSTTESDLVSGGASRNARSAHPEVVSERTEVVTKDQGTEQKVVSVKERTVGDPTALRPSYQVIQETGKDGHVRQVFIPSGSP